MTCGHTLVINIFFVFYSLIIVLINVLVVPSLAFLILHTNRLSIVVTLLLIAITDINIQVLLIALEAQTDSS